MEFIERPSPNFNDRREGTKPSLIILHFTGRKSAEHALKTLTDGERDPPVSSHYMIDEEGRVYRLVDEEKRAWHAGVSHWNGITDVNSASIGIELSNRDRKPYTEKQLDALTALCHDLQNRYDIPAQNIIGHSDIAPDRKDDPGYHFPWRELANDNIGVMPKPKLRDKFRAAALVNKPEKLRELFHQAGYGAYGFGEGKPVPTLEQLVKAFQQHYTPDVYTAPALGEQPGQPTPHMVARLRAAARQNRKYQHKS